MRTKVFAISMFAVFVAQQSSADHFNQRNIIEECAKDSTFDSRCYTYIAAYKDLLGYFVFSDDSKRARLLCLLDVPTELMTKNIPTAIPTSDPRVADLLVKRFCD